MALLHDWAESRWRHAPDRIFSIILAPRRGSSRKVEPFGQRYVGAGPAEADTKSFTTTMNSGKASKARIVKAADVIDLLVQAYALERAGAKGLTSFGKLQVRPTFSFPRLRNPLYGSHGFANAERRQNHLGTMGNCAGC